MRESARVVALVALLIVASPLAAQGRLVSRPDYSKYIDPLLAVKDFGVEYSDDPHPPSVLFPRSETNSQERPRNSVLAIVRLGPRGIPILIDCLSDDRATGVRFAGNNIVRPMNVPVGYVCLDILLNVTHGGSVFEKNCPSEEGGGACVRREYYFRPDDYYNCWEDLGKCAPRPWVGLVQRNWTREFLHRRLRFRNPLLSARE